MLKKKVNNFRRCLTLKFDKKKGRWRTKERRIKLTDTLASGLAAGGYYFIELGFHMVLALSSWQEGHKAQWCYFLLRDDDNIYHMTQRSLIQLSEDNRLFKADIELVQNDKSHPKAHLCVAEALLSFVRTSRQATSGSQTITRISLISA
ncbi:MAG: hypothetical protein V1712_02170 [Patescibacteria group bacterium]